MTYFQWKLVCDQEIVGDIITSIQMAGVLIGAVLTGQLADLFGRRHILFIEHSVLVIMWFCSAFASSWMVYAGLRFIIGALIGGKLCQMSAYCFKNLVMHGLKCVTSDESDLKQLLANC